MRFKLFPLAFLCLAPITGVAAEPTKITIDNGRSANGDFILSGSTATQQLIVTGISADGAVDLTRKATWQAMPADVVRIDSTGLVTPLKEGSATIQAAVAKLSATVKVTVNQLTTEPAVSFDQQIVPMLTKFGCNGGSCHGKTGGQNGFALSLFGFEPHEDYDFLVRESRGRRILPSAPAYSLLLRKAAGLTAHAGGRRFDAASPYFATIRRWIEQGTPPSTAKEPAVTRIEVTPAERVLARQSDQQLVVTAHLSDGSTRDVTRLARYDSNDADLAAVSPDGLVSIKNRAGTVAVMARYQTFAVVFQALAPLGKEVAQLPPARNFIDELVYARWKKLGLPPSPLADDATLLRRVTIDIAGRLPTLDETKAFLEDRSAERLDRVIDSLLASEDYAYYFANKWGSVLRNRRKTEKDDPKPTIAFHTWIKNNLHENKPYDYFVRDLLTATGKSDTLPQLVWYREVNNLNDQVEDVAQLFLGQRIMCARCHHHPLEKWSQDDYYSMAAFFTRLEIKDPPAPKADKKTKITPPPMPLEVNHKKGVAKAEHLKTKEMRSPAGLDGPLLTIAAEEDPRHKLVDWMTSPQNPFFARALANRYWKHFFGRGLVDPEDDMRATNPACNTELLDALAQHFIKSKYDLKDLVRTIVSSQAYRLSSEPNEANAEDRQNFSRFVTRRLNAEVLLDAIDDVTGVRTNFNGVPAGTRAVRLPDNQVNSYFLSVFGRPDSASACECERSSDSNLAQALHLVNSQEMLNKIGKGRLAKMVKDSRPHAEKFRELYLVAFSREPDARELEILQAHVERNTATLNVAYEDILWSIINSKEFLFNH